MIYSALMLNIDLETRMSEARAALFEGAAEKFRTALQEIPPQALKAEWDPAPLLVDAAQSWNAGSVFVKMLLAHGANPNIERAESEGERIGETALYWARDAATVIALLDAGADPDILVGCEGVCLLRDAKGKELGEIIEARLPRPPVTPGIVGEWVLFAAQRAPGGLSDDELEESYCDEYVVGFPFDHEEVRLHLHEDGRVNLKMDESDYHGQWDATEDGFAWREQDPDGPYLPEPSGFRSAVLRRDELLLWVHDRRFYLRRPETFRRKPILRKSLLAA